MDLTKSWNDAVGAIITFLSKFAVFLVILLIGWLVAKALRKLVEVVLGRVGFDRDRDPSIADRKDNRMRAIRRIELVRDRSEMIPDGLLADPQGFADLPIRSTARDVLEDFELPISDRAPRRRWRRAIISVRVVTDRDSWQQPPPR